MATLFLHLYYLIVPISWGHLSCMATLFLHLYYLIVPISWGHLSCMATLFLHLYYLIVPISWGHLSCMATLFLHLHYLIVPISWGHLSCMATLFPCKRESIMSIYSDDFVNKTNDNIVLLIMSLVSRVGLWSFSPPPPPPSLTRSLTLVLNTFYSWYILITFTYLKKIFSRAPHYWGPC